MTPPEKRRHVIECLATITVVYEAALCGGTSAGVLAVIVQPAPLVLSTRGVNILFSFHSFVAQAQLCAIGVRISQPVMMFYVHAKLCSR